MSETQTPNRDLKCPKCELTEAQKEEGKTAEQVERMRNGLEHWFQKTGLTKWEEEKKKARDAQKAKIQEAVSKEGAGQSAVSFTKVKEYEKEFGRKCFECHQGIKVGGIGHPLDPSKLGPPTVIKLLPGPDLELEAVLEDL